MGGRGSSSGTGREIATSNRIMNEFLQAGINSKLKGIARNARDGAGAYHWKGSKAVSGKTALTDMADGYSFYTRGDTTLVAGLSRKTNEKIVFANKSSHPTIKALKDKQKSNQAREAEEQRKAKERVMGMDKSTTSTYDRWYAKNKKDFEAYYYGNKK